MRNYWQLDMYICNSQKTRYFYGTEAEVQKRTNRYTADRKDLKQLSKSRVNYLKSEKQARFIDL